MQTEEVQSMSEQERAEEREALDEISEGADEERAGEERLSAGFVAIVGQPNVGKSTLMNRILGVKLAIATPKPQTTRNRILGVRTYSGQGQLAFIDTPGIHDSTKRLNRAIVRVALDSVHDVEVVMHLVDARECVAEWERHPDTPIPPREQHVMDALEQAASESPRVLVLNKVDLVADKFKLLPVIEALTARAAYSEVVPVSAITGENVERLEQTLLDMMPDDGLLFPEDMLTDQAERFIAAEFIREQLMMQTSHELPYSVAVEIEKFAEAPRRDLIEISAVIHVERDSQKGIIIGKRGARIKTIGQRARVAMEAFFGRRVFLETFVRVQQGWSEDARALQRFGYE